MSRISTRSVRVGVTLAIALSFLLQIALLPGGLNRGNVEAAEPTTARIGMLQGVDSLNPYIAYEDSSYMVFNLIYDRLTTWDEDLVQQPLIATSWEVDDWDEVDDPETTTVNEGKDRLWRYHIVENAFWHDGEELDAVDVAYSMNVNINETMWAFTPYISVKTAEYARAIDKYTVELYLKLPSQQASNLCIPIVPEHIWSQYTVGEIQYSVTNDHPIGSGPFMFVEYVRDQYVILERNPQYHLGPISYDRLIFQFYGSDQVMAEDLKKGNIDVARFPPITYNALKDEPDVDTAEVRIYYQSTIGFNNFDDDGRNGNPLVLDQNIRQAMHLAIDKQYIIDTIWGGYADMGYALPPPVVPYFHWEPETAEESLDYDLDRANALLDAAGYDKWVNGVRVVNRSDNEYASLDSPLSFRFYVRNDAPEDYAAAPYIRDMWKEIGVEVTIMTMDEGTMETSIYYANDFDVYMWYWSGDYDPTYILGVMTTDQIWNWNDPFWSNETYDELFLVQLQQTGEERRQTVFEMQKIWYESSGMITLSYPYGCYAWSTMNFEGWGDPVAHPGLTVYNYFGANPLLMGLVPIGGEDDGGGISSTALIIAVAAVIIAVVAVVLVMRMRKAKGPSEKASEKDRKRGLE